MDPHEDRISSLERADGLRRVALARLHAHVTRCTLLLHGLTLALLGLAVVCVVTLLAVLVLAWTR